MWRRLWLVAAHPAKAKAAANAFVTVTVAVLFVVYPVWMFVFFRLYLSIMHCTHCDTCCVTFFKLLKPWERRWLCNLSTWPHSTHLFVPTVSLIMAAGKAWRGLHVNQNKSPNGFLRSRLHLSAEKNMKQVRSQMTLCPNRGDWSAVQF